MAPTFGSERASLLVALNGGRPDPADYAATVSLNRSRTGSANHKMWSNPTKALVGLNTKDFGSTDAVLSWCDWYVEQPIYENECLTPNPSYRGAIDTGTLCLAGCALERGRDVLLDRLLKRSRAGEAWILVGAGSGLARRVRNHHLDKLGQSVLLVGDGERSGLDGLPYFAQAGKRGRVREGASGNHVGPFEDTENLGLSVLVAQALGGIRYPKGYADLFEALRRRWPTLPVFGLSREDRATARAWLRNPLDTLLAGRLVEWINGAPAPDHPVNVDRYDDGAIAFWLEEVGDSSTGADVVDVLLADGTHYLGSVDSGSRDSGRPGDVQDVDPQVVTEAAESFVCRWRSGERPQIVVPKPRGKRVFRIHSSGAGGRAVLVHGSGAAIQVDTPTDPPSGAIPDFKLTTRWLAVDRAHLLVVDTATPVEIVPIHPELAAGEHQRWVVRIKRGS